jgi:hypothetical protein
LTNRSTTEQLALWESFAVDPDVWESAVKTIRLLGKLSSPRQKLYHQAKQEPKALGLIYL